MGASLGFPRGTADCRDYLDSKVTFARDVDPREIGLQKYAQLFRERVRDGIQPAAASSTTPFLPVLNSFQPFVSTRDVNYRTTLPVVPLVKSHLNLGAWRSRWEADTMEMLEDFDFVEAFTPNDQHVGLTIPYEYQQQPHMYVPDFVVRLRNEKQVMLEIKGRGGEIRAPDRSSPRTRPRENGSPRSTTTDNSVLGSSRYAVTWRSCGGPSPNMWRAPPSCRSAS